MTLCAAPAVGAVDAPCECVGPEFKVGCASVEGSCEPPFSP